MDTKRVFFAVLPPRSLHKRLSKILRSLNNLFPEKNIRWIEVENLHITLQFLNSVSKEQLHILIKEVHRVLKNTSSFRLELGGLEWFPDPEHPKVIALSVQHQEILFNLSEAIRPALERLTLIPSSHPFRGHMSLGRLNHNDICRDLLTRVKMPTIQTIRIDRIYLIESRPAEGGRVYYILEEFNLKDI